MIVAIADTHAAIWFLSLDQRLSVSAKKFMDRVEADHDEIGLSAISFVEMIYLVEKSRIPAQRFTELAQAAHDPDGLFVEIPVDLAVARALSKVNATQIPDMPDRIIAATAVYLNVPVISRDGKIRVSAVSTIW